MKPFSLKEYLKNPNKKVVTRDREEVRIICTDRKTAHFPIVALCTSTITGQEACRSYDMNGNYSVEEESILDLMFAEECDKSINTVKTAFIEKAAYWLQEHVNDYLFDDGVPGRPWLKCKSDMFDDFKKAMEE